MGRWFAVALLVVAGCSSEGGDRTSATGSGTTEDTGGTGDETGTETGDDTGAGTEDDTGAGTEDDTGTESESSTEGTGTGDTTTDDTTSGTGDPPQGPCAAWCEAVVAAGCSDGPSDLEECWAGCGAIAKACPDAFAATVDCAQESPSATCVADQPLLAGCEAESLALVGCADPCAATCVGAYAVGCEGGPPTFESCTGGCQQATASCPAQVEATLACAGLGPDAWECTDFGPAPVGCTQEQFDLLLCVAPGVVCESACDSVLALGCALGPPDLAGCAGGCTQVLGGPCQQAELDLLGCAGPGAEFSCDADGFPSPAACPEETAALKACLGV